MNRWIALFRGINVGGHNILPMKGLIGVLENLGCQDVRTYIQSGNAAFNFAGNREALSGKIVESVFDAYGFEPVVLLVSVRKMNRIREMNPFREGDIEPRRLHVFFLESSPVNPDLSALERVRLDNERFQLVDDAFYLHAPNGIGRSKLFALVEKALDVKATARNWNTIRKIGDLARTPK